MVEQLLNDAFARLYMLIVLGVLGAACEGLGRVVAPSRRLWVPWVSHDQPLQEVNWSEHRLVDSDVLQSIVHEIDFTSLAFEISFVLSLLQDWNEGGKRSLSYWVGYTIVWVLADFPEFVKIQILAGINLTARILARALILILPLVATKEILERRGRLRLRLLTLLAYLLRLPKHVSVLEEHIERT